MNKIIKNHSGVSLVAVVIITGVLLVGGYVGYYLVMDKAEEGVEMMEENMTDNTDDISQMIKKDESMMDGGGKDVDYRGKVLAGTSAKLLDFNIYDFEAASESGKLVVLYFYADWCPICRAEFPKMEQAFNELTTHDVIGFRVNFNDDQTDEDEKALSIEHGVAYQHTKVFIRNGERIGKWPDSWDKDRYLSEINKRLQIR